VGQDIPMFGKSVSGTDVLMEEHSTAKVWPIVVIVEIACVYHTTETSLGKDFLIEVHRPTKSGEKLRCVAVRPDRRAQVNPGVKQLLFPVRGGFETEWIEKYGNLWEYAVLSGTSPL